MVVHDHDDHDDHDSEHDETYELPDDVGNATDDEKGWGYFFRKGELLVAENDVNHPWVQAAIDEFGMERSDTAAAVEGVSCWVMAAEADAGDRIPDVVDQLRRVDEGEPAPAVAPNHVLFGATHWTLAPSGAAAPTPHRLDDLPPVTTPEDDRPRVVVLDTGAVAHRWYADRVAPTTQASVEMAHPQGGHGTFIAGVILRYAPDAIIDFPVVLGPAGDVDDLTLAAALVTHARSDVVLLSLGGYTHDNYGLLAVGSVLQAMAKTNPRLAVVAAAGNAASNRPFFPAAQKGVIAVGALDDSGNRAAFSNFGSWVDTSAVGAGVVSTFLDADDSAGNGSVKSGKGKMLASFGGWAEWSGTSFAAPAVAGALAAGTGPSSSAANVASDLLTTQPYGAIANGGAIVSPAAVVSQL